MSGIRVTYSGLISFVVGAVSVFTGLIFTLIVTRQLTQVEFGTWSLIGSLTAYVLILSPIVSYWTTREIARGKETGKTAILSNSFFSVGATIFYLIIIYFFSGQTQVDKNILIFASILVPIGFVRTTLIAISGGHKPQLAEYGLLTFELTKIPAAIILVYFLEMGLAGAILTSALAQLASTIVLIIRNREKIKGRFNKKYVKNWLKLFWLPTYPNLTQAITNSDVVIFTLLTGSVIGVAYWGVARAISVVVMHSEKINRALYPKLLGGGKKEYLQENLSRVFYFSFPLVAMSIIFSRPALFALNPLYEVAVPVVIILVPVIFLRSLNNIFELALTGIEKVDTNEKSTFKDYLKSRLFYIPTLRITQRLAYISSLAVMLLIFLPFNHSDIELVSFWAIIALITQIPLTLYLYTIVRKEFTPKIDIKPIVKYLMSAVFVFGLIFFLMEKFLTYKISIYEFLPEFLLYVILGIVGYFLLTFVLDHKTRVLVKAVIKEIKK